MVTAGYLVAKLRATDSAPICRFFSFGTCGVEPGYIRTVRHLICSVDTRS